MKQYNDLTTKEIMGKLRHYARKYGTPPYGREIEGTEELLIAAADALERLADYEDTGLEPKDVTDLMAAHGTAIEQLAEYRTIGLKAKSNCETHWKDGGKDIEKLLADMKEETEREISCAKSRDSRVAWYWTYIGALDMAQQIGAIDDARRQQLYKEAEGLKQAIGEGDDMTKMRQLPAVRKQPDDGGPVDAACDLVNRNAEEQAALRGAMEAGNQAAARREARQRRRQLRRTLRDIGYISAGAGAVLIGLAVTGLAPWWIGVVAMLAAQAMFYAVRR